MRYNVGDKKKKEKKNSYHQLVAFLRTARYVYLIKSIVVNVVFDFSTIKILLVNVSVSLQSKCNLYHPNDGIELLIRKNMHLGGSSNLNTESTILGLFLYSRDDIFEV